MSRPMRESTARTKASNQGCWYAVAAFGFEEKERNVLRNILRISKQHPLEFRFQSQRDGKPAVVIVNADNADALGRWAQLERSRGSSAESMTAIYLARSAPPAGAVYYLNRPFFATRLFSLLERVVTERYGYVPDSAMASADDMLMLTSDTAFAHSSRGQAVTVPNKKAAAPVATGRSALIVDDSLPVRIQLKVPLLKVFDHVDVADTGEAALELIETRTYALILLDVTLPGIDAYETCMQIRKHPQHADTPVVMLTSNSSPGDKIRGKLAGCETYLIKPVKATVFESVLGALVPARAAR